MKKIKKVKKTTVKNKLDKIFSQRVRERGACERCGKTESLQCSHIYSRNNLATRWLELNAFCYCAGCHFWWHQHPLEAQEFTINFLGREKYEELRAMAYSIKQWTIKDLNELLLELSKTKCSGN